MSSDLTGPAGDTPHDPHHPLESHHPIGPSGAAPPAPPATPSVAPDQAMFSQATPPPPVASGPQPGIPTLPTPVPSRPTPATAPLVAGMPPHGAAVPGAVPPYGAIGPATTTRRTHKRRSRSGAIVGTLLFAVLVGALGASARFGWNMWQTRDSVGALGEGRFPDTGSLPTDPYERPHGRYLDVTTIYRSGDHREIERTQRDLATGDFVRDKWLGHERLPGFTMRVEDGVAQSLSTQIAGEASWSPYEYPIDSAHDGLTSSILMFQDVITPEVRTYVQVLEERDEIVVLPTTEPVERFVAGPNAPSARGNLSSDRTVKARRYHLAIDARQFASDDPSGFAAYMGTFPIGETYTVWMDASGVVRKIEFRYDDDTSNTVIYSDLTLSPPTSSGETEGER